jgi:hypothetical protein
MPRSDLKEQDFLVTAAPGREVALAVGHTQAILPRCSVCCRAAAETLLTRPAGPGALHPGTELRYFVVEQ